MNCVRRLSRRVLNPLDPFAGRLRALGYAVSVAAAGLVLVEAAAFPAAAAAQPSGEPFEIVPGSFHVTASPNHAAAHEDLTTSVDFAHTGIHTHNDVRTVVVNLPPGFVGSNTAVPTCTIAQLIGTRALGEFANPKCPLASQVGQISVDLDATGQSEEITVPVYSMEVTSPGVTAELGFNLFGIVTQTVPVTVRPGDSGLTVTTPDIEKVGEGHNVSFTVWGVPAAHVHDSQRGLECNSIFVPHCATNSGSGDSEPVHPLAAGIPARPFLSNPTGCEPHVAEIEAYSWEEPGNPSTAKTEIGPIDECERVPFSPEIAAVPTTDSAESPTGLNVSLLVPQAWENPVSLSTANLEDAVVTLPAGMSLNPSAGSGLGSCTEGQLAEETYDSPPSVGCPAESKVGSVEVETPVLTERATGAVYVAKPFENPFHSLLALYIVAKIPSRGIIVKVAGEVHADPLTGQLTTTFDENPQVPFSVFRLNFRQGATSPLVSPPTCGTYTAEADLTPWSTPLEPSHLTAGFPVETGVNGGPCPSGGTPPFHPGLLAGSTNNAAGQYTPFYIRLARQDGEQEITHFSIKLPPGVIGKLAGIPLCSDAAIAQALSREHEQGGAEEEASPSCPAASEVGHTLVEAGVGTVLAQAPGKVYLAGPYHGAPISVVAITSAKVGPFDLGTVVVREALKVNPETGEVFVDATGSDPLPHIIDGIPTHLRDIRIYMDKPEFVLNPTSCEPTSTASTVLGSGKDFVSEADDNPITVSSRFQAADCAALGFKPKLSLQLKGPTHRSGVPALRAVLHARKGDANISHAEVILPASEYLKQEHIKTICTRVQFNEGAGNGERCPAGSVYGRARAVTPLLAEALEGPVYLRSNGGERQLPDLVAALNGQEINIDLVGYIDSVREKNKRGEVISRIRNRFEVVPDAPVTKFVLEMDGGKKGLLVNSTNLCKGTHKAEVNFTAHNGKVRDFKPPLKASCKGGQKKHPKKG